MRLVGARTPHWSPFPADSALQSWNDAGMLVRTPKIENPLDCAARKLRDISDDHELLKSSIDAGSVRRILVHIHNINVSVLESPRDHLNATKRLKDFAFTLIRIANRSELPNQRLSNQMGRVAEYLRAASEELARSDAIPNWGRSAGGDAGEQLEVWEGEGGAPAPRSRR